MRWVVLVFGACQFTPGSLGVTGGGTEERTVISGAGAVIPGVAAWVVGGSVGGMFRMPDVVEATVGDGAHADFPLLVSISGTWLRDVANGGDVSRADGFDIHFAADSAGTVRLSHEVESYAPVTGDLLAWVKVPSLASSTVLYLHYGDPTITTSQESVAAVWSGGYELVTHLGALTDATGKTSVFSATSVAAAPGRIDDGRDFNGTSDQVDAGSAAAIDNVFAAGGTAEGWFFATGYGEGGFGRLFDKGHTNGWSMAINNSNAVETLAFVYGASTSFGEWNGPSNAVALNAWHHAAVVFTASSSASDPLMYIDGLPLTGISELVAPSGTMSSDAAFDLVMGNRQATDRTFDGLLDELRLSRVVRSPAWLLTQYRNQLDPAAFITVGPPQ